MLELLSLKPEAFGIDISDLSLKIAKLKKKGKFFDLASFGEAKIEKGIIKEGKIKDEKKLAEIIKEAIKKIEGEKIKTKYVVASLPEEKSFSQIIKMPRLSEEDLKSAIVYEIEKYIPLAVEEVYFDCQTIPPVFNSQEKIDVLISAIPKKIANSYLSCLKLANLEPVAFEIESMAISRALIKNEFSPEPILIIDLGATRTSFIIFYGKAIRFTSSIPISSIGFTEIISKNLKIPFQEAEELKKKYGLEEKVKLKIEDQKTVKLVVRGKIFEALIPPLVDLVDQIRRCLDFFEGRFKKKIKKILLCGGGANLKGLVELLAMELKISVELGNPWLNILKKPERGSKKLAPEKSLAFTTALGLALRGIK